MASFIDIARNWLARGSLLSVRSITLEFAPEDPEDGVPSRVKITATVHSMAGTMTTKAIHEGHDARIATGWNAALEDAIKKLKAEVG